MKCHYGNVHVYTCKRQDGSTFEIYAGGDSRGGGWEGKDFDLVIGPERLVDPIVKPIGWRVSKTLPEFLALPWPDMGTPKVPDQLWHELREDLLEHTEVEKVLVMCMGGHGRTGTALAILCQLLFKKWDTVDGVVDHLRGLYCEEIVETVEQLKYIGRVTDIPYKGITDPAKSYGGYTSSDWSKSKYYSSSKSDDDEEDDGQLSLLDTEILDTRTGEVRSKGGYNGLRGRMESESIDDYLDAIERETLAFQHAQGLAKNWGARLELEHGTYYLKWGYGHNTYEEQFHDLQSLVSYLSMADDTQETTP